MLPASTAVIIATMGRAAAVSRLVRHINQQTCLPDTIIISATERADVPLLPTNVTTNVIIGEPGLAAQRNRALSAIPSTVQYVVFFDDDFIPSNLWIERVQQFFALHPEAVAVTGRVIADGVKLGGLEWSQGLSIVECADRQAAPPESDRYVARPKKSPYGCNMAYRLESIKSQTFDERLVLYGWLEDRDFGFRTSSQNAHAYWTDTLWGVHLGIKDARRSDLSFGYSQVVNPWYLSRKGTMTTLDTAAFIARGVAQNAGKLVLGDSHFNRFNRLKGNALGIADILAGRWRPERAADF